MLFGGQGGEKNGRSYAERSILDSFRSVGGVPHAQKAQPTYETMDRWKKICGRIHLIQNAHENRPERASFYRRTDIGGRKQEEKDKARRFGQKIRTEETVRLLFFLAGTVDIAENPENAAGKVN